MAQSFDQVSKEGKNDVWSLWAAHMANLKWKLLQSSLLYFPILGPYVIPTFLSTF